MWLVLVVCVASLIVLMSPPVARAEPVAFEDARLAWFREAKFGMFIHWGLYAIPAGQWQGRDYPWIGEWIMLTARDSSPHGPYVPV